MDQDAEILFPDITLTLRTSQGEETVTVREFRFGQSARVMPLVRPLLEDFAELSVESVEGDLAPLFELQTRHWETFLELVAIACGQPREWVEGLPDEEGQKLAVAFWRVNTPFFVRRLAAEIETLRRLFASRMSSMSSSAPATAATPESSPSD